MSSKRKEKVFHLQNHSYIINENGFPDINRDSHISHFSNFHFSSLPKWNLFKSSPDCLSMPLPCFLAIVYCLSYSIVLSGYSDILVNSMKFNQ